MVPQTKNNWTLLFLQFRAFRKDKWLFTLKNGNQDRIVYLNCFVWFFVWLTKVVSETTYTTTRPETEPGQRPINDGLGDHESGVSGATKRSKTHRFCFRNGDNWRCLNVPPSVILRVLTMLFPVSNKTVWRHQVYNNALFSGCSITPRLHAEFPGLLIKLFHD